jgi:hypothetical protein
MGMPRHRPIHEHPAVAIDIMMMEFDLRRVDTLIEKIEKRGERILAARESHENSVIGIEFDDFRADFRGVDKHAESSSSITPSIHG